MQRSGLTARQVCTRARRIPLESPGAVFHISALCSSQLATAPMRRKRVSAWEEEAPCLYTLSEMPVRCSGLFWRFISLINCFEIFNYVKVNISYQEFVFRTFSYIICITSSSRVYTHPKGTLSKHTHIYTSRRSSANSK